MGKHDEGEGLSTREMEQMGVFKEMQSALTEDQHEQMMDLAAMAAEELHPDLVPWVEDGAFGKMIRHPLVYDMTVSALPGAANRTYAYKRKALHEAIEAEDWHQVVFLHERPHRLNALIDYVTGRDDASGLPLPVWSVAIKDLRTAMDLTADVWVDSENIEQNEKDWRCVLAPEYLSLWLGTEQERADFDALPDPIPAWRGGIVGDWSWTTDIKIARFFANRSKYPIRRALIPKADCFGYFTRRGESELLVRLTPEREPLVYPNRFNPGWPK